jgi:hypothetical protein
MPGMFAAVAHALNTFSEMLEPDVSSGTFTLECMCLLCFGPVLLRFSFLENGALADTLETYNPHGLYSIDSTWDENIGSAWFIERVKRTTT